MIAITVRVMVRDETNGKVLAFKEETILSTDDEIRSTPNMVAAAAQDIAASPIRQAVQRASDELRAGA